MMFLKNGFDRDRLNELVFSPEDAILSDLLVGEEELSAHWGVAHHLKGQAAYIPLVIDSRHDGFQKALMKLSGTLAAGEPLVINELIAGYTYLKHVTVNVYCSGVDLPFDVNIIDATDAAVGTETIDHAVVAGGNTNVAGDTGFVLPAQEYISRDAPKYLSIKFPSLPIADDGNGFQAWNEDCKPFPCFRIEVHAGIDDSSIVHRRFAKGTDCCEFDEFPTCPTDI